MVARARLTMEEFVALVEQNPERHFKFNAEGQVIEVTPKLLHGWIQARLAALFSDYVEQSLPGYGVVTEVAFNLAGWPSRPDVAIVRMDSDPIPTAAPLVAVEIKSDSNSYTDLRHKAQKYLDHGTKMVLLVYPQKRIVEVYQPDLDLQICTIEDPLEGGAVLPGFSTAISSLFPKMG